MKHTSMLSLYRLVIPFSLMLSACGAQAQPVTGHYAGQVENSNAFIGLVTNGKTLQAYFCDGTREVAPVLWVWFRGDLNGSAFDLTNDSGDRLTGEFNTNGANGTIILADGTALNFQAEPVSEPAGLYRLEETMNGAEISIGWIVLANGELRGVTKSGAKLTSATSRPLGWVDPDIDP